MRTELDRIAENEYARKEGREEEKMVMAKRLRDLGVDPQIIQEATALIGRPPRRHPRLRCQAQPVGGLLPRLHKNGTRQPPGCNRGNENGPFRPNLSRACNQIAQKAFFLQSRLYLKFSHPYPWGCRAAAGEKGGPPKKG